MSETAVRRVNAERFEHDPGEMGEPSIEDQRREVASRGRLRQVRNQRTGIVCDYDERRPKHSRCGDRLTPDYHWYDAAGERLAGVRADLCPACSRRTALEAAGTPVQACSSCGALMYWGVGSKGGRLPISIKTGESHFRDCPHAQSHSKKGPRK